MALNLKTVTEYWRKSGGEYDQSAEKAIIGIPNLQSFVASIAGQTLIDSEHGDLLVSMHNNLKEVTKERDTYRDMCVGLLAFANTVKEYAEKYPHDTGLYDLVVCEIKKLEQLK